MASAAKRAGRGRLGGGWEGGTGTARPPIGGGPRVCPDRKQTGNIYPSAGVFFAEDVVAVPKMRRNRGGPIYGL